MQAEWTEATKACDATIREKAKNLNSVHQNSIAPSKKQLYSGVEK